MSVWLKRDTLFRIVCNLRTPVPNAEKVGTGFFVMKEDRVYLLTAAHVAADTTAETVCVISDAEGNPRTIPLRAMLGMNRWSYHPDADIAMVMVPPSPLTTSALEGRIFPYEQINLSEDPLSRDTEITSIGFPHGLGAMGKFAPLSFRTYVAGEKLTLLRADNDRPCEFFVLENPSVGGYSGCPVLELGHSSHHGMLQVGGRGTLINGIMHGTTRDETGGKMALVTPCHYLRGWL